MPGVPSRWGVLIAGCSKRNLMKVAFFAAPLRNTGLLLFECSTKLRRKAKSKKEDVSHHTYMIHLHCVGTMTLLYSIHFQYGLYLVIMHCILDSPKGYIPCLLLMESNSYGTI